jgi:putative ATP-binding cassette transporter
LSGGEQQRLAFARLLITMPTIAILDEATAALDEASQSQLMELFRFRLAATTVISISHRPGLAKFHNRQIVLRKEINGARVSVGETIQTPLARMRRALTALNDA